MAKGGLSQEQHFCHRDESFDGFGPSPFYSRCPTGPWPRSASGVKPDITFMMTSLFCELSQAVEHVC